MHQRALLPQCLVWLLVINNQNNHYHSGMILSVDCDSSEEVKNYIIGKEHQKDLLFISE